MFPAAVQVPKNGLIQFSGIDLYRFMPKDSVYQKQIA